MVRWLATFGLIALASCNALVGFNGLQRVQDGVDDENDVEDEDGAPRKRTDGGASEGGTTPAGCDKTKPFGAAVPLPTEINSTAHETSPTLTADERTIVFQRTTGVDGGDLLIATRPSRDVAFGAPRSLAELNGNGADYSPTITGDGLILYWIEFNKKVSPNSMDVFMATRPTPADLFTNPRAFDEVNTSSEEFNVLVSNAGNTLWFNSDRSGAAKLYRSDRNPDTNEFTTPITVAEPKVVGRFVFAEDLLTIYSSVSTTPDNSDVAVAHRENTGDNFGTMAALPGALNAPAHDGSPWVSPDECRIYFSSARNGKDDLFVAERLP